MNKRSFLIPIACTLGLLLATLFMAVTSPGAARAQAGEAPQAAPPGPAPEEQGPEIRVTHSLSRADQPDIVIDLNGNVHIAYCDNYSTTLREIWYTMLDNEGNTLIDDTRLTADDGYQSTRPAIVLDSQNKVHITWRDQRWDGGSHQEVTYTKLDPFLDDMDGDPAISSTITLVDDTRLSDNQSWYIYGIRLAVDSNDDIHIVWDDDDAEALYYMKIDSDGNELVAETAFRHADQWRALPDLALDSNDNLHVAWAEYEDTESDEVYYMMLDNFGETLIDTTRLTPDDDEYSKWTGIVVDDADKVHIVWQDDKDANKEIYYTKIDPSLDDQDGDTADEAIITLINDTRLTADDGDKSRHPVIATDGHMLHITWEEDDTNNIHYMVLGLDGGILLTDTALTTNGTVYPSNKWTLPYMDIDANGVAHVTWCDSRDGAYEVYYTSYTWILGYLDGHVYDAVTLDPIEGVMVNAGAGANTDVSGYYTMTTPVGVYTATAEHVQYTTAYSPNVEVLTGALTTVDFYLVPRGRLFGYVSDYDTGAPLEATITISGWGSLTSDPDTGYYELYIDAGTYAVSAGVQDYFTGTATVDILAGADTRQDFVLVYPVAFEPNPLHVNLDWDTTASFPATLTNRLPVTYPFGFIERPGGFMPVLLGLDNEPGVDDEPSLEGEVTSIAPTVLIARADGDAEPLRGLLQAYGDLGAVDDMDVHYHTPSLTDLLPYDVVITWGNNSYADHDAMGDVLADYIDAGGRVINTMWGMLPNTSISVGGRFWYEDYTALKASGVTISPQCLGTYDAGHPIMAGVTDACALIRLSIAYLTPGSHAVAQFTDGSFFVATKDDGSVVNVVAYLGDNSWTGQVPDMIHNAIFWQVQGLDVPWLGQTPISATIPASTTLPGQLTASMLFSATLDAGVDQPGDYLATLVVSGDPNLHVPVTMTVLPPADMGKVQGTVTDNCLGDPLEDVWVEILGGDPITETWTDVDGYYAAWLYEGSYDLVYSMAGYLTDTETVNIVAGATVDQDIILVPDRPCIAVDPAAFEVWVLTSTMTYTHATGLDIYNDGGQDLEYELREQEDGFTFTLGVPYIVDAPATTLSLDPAAKGSEHAKAHGPRQFTMSAGLPLEGPFDVLLVSPDSTSGDISGLLATLGAFPDLDVTVWDNTSGNPTAGDMAPYDVVMIGNDYNWESASLDKIAIGNALADYIDGGGKVIESLYVQSNDEFGFGGRYMTDGYSPLTVASLDNQNPDTMNILEPGHPVMAGVVSIGDTWGHQDPGLAAGATLLASWNASGYVAVAVNYDIVALNQLIFHAADWTGDVGTLLHNAIVWLAGAPPDVPWFWEDPITGTVPALDMANVDIMFTALYTDMVTPMPLGAYSATLVVRHNAPVAGSPSLPVFMHIVAEYITPTASFSADPACLGDAMLFNNTSLDGVPPTEYYLWDFGDGMTLTLTSADPVGHTYAAAGTYTVTLTAHAYQTGAEDTYTAVVEVLPLPAAGFTYAMDGLTVDFTNTSTDATSYWWDFGDGFTSTLENPTHTFASLSDYLVTLSAYGDCPMDQVAMTVTVGALADLSLTKAAAPDPVQPGGTLTYTLTVVNNGPDSATNVILSDTLPAGVIFVSASAGCVEAGGVVTCSLGDFANGGMATVVIAVTVPGTEGVLTNTAAVTADQADPDMANNTASIDTPVGHPRFYLPIINK